MRKVKHYYKKTVKCVTCGKEFETVTRRSRYCSSACKQVAYRNRLKRRVTVERSS
jgi:endogenous inhibitor of DNA gyrase (YacG/DUF329 family)